MFDEIKHIFAHDTLLIYPHFNERFDMHTDASDFQPIIAIKEDVKPITFYRRKLTGQQTWNTVAKKVIA